MLTFIHIFLYFLYQFQFSYNANNDYSVLVTKSIEELMLDYEDDLNSMVAVTELEEPVTSEDFYNEVEYREENTALGIIYFGSPASFLRLDAESVLHILINTKKNMFPIGRILLAWDMITDGLTPALLQGREFAAFGSLLNFVPEEDLYYVNFGDSSVLRYFAFHSENLEPRKYGVLAAAYKRYYGDDWYKNSTFINELGYILCGFPPSELAKIKPKTFTGINIDVISKLRICSLEQTQVLYDIATHADAYGTPYSWTSHEISRIEFLFTCIPKEDISTIMFEAINAISPVVMETLELDKLAQFTQQQVLRMNSKARRIYILKMQLKTTLQFDTLLSYASSQIKFPNYMLTIVLIMILRL